MKKYLLVLTLLLLPILILLSSPTQAEAAVDLYILNPTTLIVSPTSVQAGGTATLPAYDLRNGGSTNAPAFTIGYYLSSDPEIRKWDTLLYTATAPAGLAALTTVARVSRIVDIPVSIPPGSYYIGILVDNQEAVSESNESNNYKSAALVVTGVAPTVTTLTPQDITTTSATLRANVTSLGIPASISARGICVGATSNPVDPTRRCDTASTGGLGEFTKNFSGFNAGTTYHYYGYAINSTGTGYSADATFTTTAAPVPHTLTVHKAGTGSGTVTIPGQTCTPTCSISTSGSIVITTTVAAGSSRNWSGGGCEGSGNTCSVSMATANQTVTVTFSPIAATNYRVTVDKGGTGNGTVTGPGINCGATCLTSFTNIASGGTYPFNVPTPAPGSTFAGWSGSGCSGTGTCTITNITTDKSVIATFNTNVVPGVTSIFAGAPPDGNIFKLYAGPGIHLIPNVGERKVTVELDDRNLPDLANCGDSTTGKVWWNASTKRLVCGTDRGGGAGGVSKIIAGPNITVSPTSGLGDVTITATVAPGTGDNLGVVGAPGSHTAQQNINLNGHFLSGNDTSKGLFVEPNGNVSFQNVIPRVIINPTDGSIMAWGDIKTIDANNSTKVILTDAGQIQAFGNIFSSSSFIAGGRDADENIVPQVIIAANGRIEAKSNTVDAIYVPNGGVTAKNLKVMTILSEQFHTCDSTTRGMLEMIDGGNGVMDRLKICIKNSLNAYEWANLN
ncbi:MAG: CARDB domain-containing protein [Candidatus Vogelbacteria bacterium]